MGAITADVIQAKGSAGMTVVGSRADDNTITIHMPFDFPYNKQQSSVLYVSGNSWVGFGTDAEHLRINRRDTSINTLYYIEEIVSGVETVRIRFEGNSQYSNWGANDLIWEIILFKEGGITLVIEKTPRNGTDEFINPEGDALGAAFYSQKSYGFMPTTTEGISYQYVEGSYLPYRVRYLVTDDEGIKTYTDKWVKIGDKPLTESLLIEQGVAVFPQDLIGIVENAEVYFYTDEPLEEVTSSLRLTLDATSPTQYVYQTEEFVIDEGKVIKEIELDTADDVTVAFSLNGGESFMIYDVLEQEYKEVTEELVYMHKDHLRRMDYEVLNQMYTEGIRFKYRFDKPLLDGTCTLKGVKIKYAEWV